MATGGRSAVHDATKSDGLSLTRRRPANPGGAICRRDNSAGWFYPWVDTLLRHSLRECSRTLHVICLHFKISQIVADAIAVRAARLRRRPNAAQSIEEEGDHG